MVNILKFNNTKKPVFVQFLSPDFVELPTNNLDPLGNPITQAVELHPTLWEMDGVYFKVVSFSQSAKGYLTLKIVGISSKKEDFVVCIDLRKRKTTPPEDVFGA